MNTQNAAEKLIYCIRESMRTLAGDTAIAFSGGIDSTLLLHLSGYRLHPYTVGIKGSRDISNALNVTESLGFRTEVIEVTEQDVRNALKDLKALDPGITEVEAGYETVLYLTLKSIRERSLVTGQGSDELFYGYRKYLDGEKSNVADLKKLFDITFPREIEIAALFRKSLITPYLSACVTGLSRTLTWADCILNGINKAVVRKAAEIAGLPEQIVSMPKKAAQYGSGIQKIIRSVGFRDV